MIRLSHAANCLLKKILYNVLTVEKFAFYFYYPSIHRHELRLCMSKAKNFESEIRQYRLEDKQYRQIEIGFKRETLI